MSVGSAVQVREGVEDIAERRGFDEQAVCIACVCSDTLAVEPFQVMAHTLLDIHKGSVVTGGTQGAHIGLGETLVTAFEVFRKGNVFDLAAVVITDHGSGHILEGLAVTRAHVEDAAHGFLAKAGLDSGAFSKAYR